MLKADLAVHHWLSTHHGVITRERAMKLGLTAGMITSRIRRKEWRVAHPGVYVAASSPVTNQQVLLAALAAAGHGAVASHFSAAWLWDLAGPPTEPWIILPANRRPRLQGVHAARCSDPTPTDSRQGLPCTPAARTLIDCAGMMPPEQLAGLVDRALATKAVTLTALAGILVPGPPGQGRAGRRALRDCLTERGMVGGPSPSVLESQMARLIASTGLPVPAAEVKAGRAGEYRLDFAYPDVRFAVEVDGYVWHSSPEQMRRDVARRNALLRAGWVVLVYTWWDVTHEPDRVVAEIATTYASVMTSGAGKLLGAQQQ